jgi:hypothetical protein
VLYDTPTMAITWVLSLLGLMVALVPAFLLFKRDVNAAAFLAELEKLLDHGQFARARQLCRAVASPLGHVTTEALALRLEATVLRADDEADYRSAPETVPFEQRVREALEPTAQAELETALGLAVTAGAGGAMALASLWPPWPPLASLLGIAGASVAIWAVRMHASIRGGMELALERLPQLVLPDDEMHLEEDEP